MIAFRCSGCGKQLQVQDDLAGKRAGCPQCKQAVLVPQATVAPAGVVQAKVSPPQPMPPATPPRGETEPQSPSPALDVTAPEPEDTPSSPEVEGGKLDFLAPAQQPDEIGRLGSYRILKVLGAGGMGMVLQAEDPALKRNVALKVMRSELAAKEANRQRFLREAQATAAVEHPNIIHIHQVGQERNVPFLAMPFLKGEALDTRLKRDGKLPVAEAVRIARQTAEGLAAAHEVGLIHRDIKPANLWLEAKTGLVKILDFGLARAAGDNSHLTQSGAIVGTPAYMAPEQAKSEQVDARCDLFSLGAVLYQMLTGEKPFKGHDTMSLLLALAIQNPRPVRELNPTVPPALGDLVMQLLEKDPAARPASTRVVADALAAIEDETTQQLSLSEVRGPAEGIPTKLLRVAAAAVGWLYWLIVRLYRIPGRTGLVIKSGTAVVILILLFLLLTKPRSVPDSSITNSIGIKLAYIPPGEFMMGSGSIYEPKDRPQHKVKISKPYCMGIFEVKQSEYEKVMGRNPSSFKDMDHPVAQINLSDASEFCKKLSEMPEERKAGRVYRLPTEAEWEYSCRAGTTTVFHYGDSLSSKQANFNGEYPYGKVEKGPVIGKTTKVGSYLPNAWGLYDMHGNVWEWCLDGSRDYPYQPAKELIVDPEGPDAAGSVGVLRGGSWNDAAAMCRSAYRFAWLSANPGHLANVGFRVILTRAAGNQLPKMITNSIGMKLAYVPAGDFAMGASNVDPKPHPSEGPQHKVKVTKGFYMGIYEVKQFSYEKVMGRNPSSFKDSPDNPVETVNWDDAVEFCKKLSEMPEERKAGRVYRLPTEAEWEYSCRAGTTTDDSMSSNQANFNGEEHLRGVEKGPNIGKTVKVGSYSPNAWGLYDMHGNVWEWCVDSPRDYPKESPKESIVDSRGLETAGGDRVLRGGGWYSGAVACRSWFRNLNPKSLRDPSVGFRVVLELK